MASAAIRPGSGLVGPIPRRRKSFTGDRWQPDPDEWDPDLPYGGKVYLARKPNPPSFVQRVVEAAFIVFVVSFCYYAYFYFDHLHFNTMHAVAHLGHPNAQHFVGQRYLKGKGVDQDHDKAMHWFRKAASQGHPHASHNLAVGHLKGYTQLEYGEAHKLIEHAAKHGIPEAEDALAQVCEDGGCM